jgi:hypothetical protein
VTYRTRRLGGAPPPGWTLPPTWGQPLHDPQPLHTAGMAGRWLYPTVATGGFLLVAGFMLAHDDPTPGLSARGLLTIALAATVVVLLTIRRTAGPGPLTRALFEYTVVFLLAVLVATTGIPLDHPTTASGGPQTSAAHDQRPALVKTIDSFRDWLGEWRTWARTETDRRAHASTPTPALSPTTTRRPR